MLFALHRLAVGLEAVTLSLEQGTDLHAADQKAL